VFAASVTGGGRRMATHAYDLPTDEAARESETGVAEREARRRSIVASTTSGTRPSRGCWNAAAHSWLSARSSAGALTTGAHGEAVREHWRVDWPRRQSAGAAAPFFRDWLAWPVRPATRAGRITSKGSRELARTGSARRGAAGGRGTTRLAAAAASSASWPSCSPIRAMAWPSLEWVAGRVPPPTSSRPGGRGPRALRHELDRRPPRTGGRGPIVHLPMSRRPFGRSADCAEPCAGAGSAGAVGPHRRRGRRFAGAVRRLA